MGLSSCVLSTLEQRQGCLLCMMLMLYLVQLSITAVLITKRLARQVQRQASA